MAITLHEKGSLIFPIHSIVLNSKLKPLAEYGDREPEIQPHLWADGRGPQ
jgi:hypothetical protein